MNRKFTQKDHRISNALPAGFDQRFFSKLEVVKSNNIDQVPSFFANIKASFIPLTCALCLVLIILGQSSETLSPASQVLSIIEDLDNDLSSLEEENWDILLQLADNP